MDSSIEIFQPIQDEFQGGFRREQDERFNGMGLRVRINDRHY